MSGDNIALTRQQVREVDRRAIEEYGIPGIVLMENAGRNVAGFIRQAYEKNGSKESYTAVVCGRGNNGGDGFVIARHLDNFNIPVELFLACDPTRLSGDAATNFHIVEKMRIRHHPFDRLESIAAASNRLQRANIIVDAVLGTGFSGQVRAPLDAVIAAINQANETSTVAIDVPSGFDCDTGQPSNATVRANTTVTFVANKVGFQAPGAAKYTGRVEVADIGAPPTIIQDVLEGGSG